MGLFVSRESLDLLMRIHILIKKVLFADYGSCIEWNLSVLFSTKALSIVDLGWPYSSKSEISSKREISSPHWSRSAIFYKKSYLAKQAA